MVMLTCRRRGFSLIETVIVIGIVTMLLGLFLPAVQRAREAAFRTSCQNNLRQLALSMQQYEATTGVFPPLWSYSLFWSGGRPAGSLNDWTAYVLPYLDQSDIGDEYDLSRMFFQNTTAIARPLPVLRCPSTPRGEAVTTETNWTPARVSSNASLTALDPYFTASFTAAVTDYAGFGTIAAEWQEVLSYPAGDSELTGVLTGPPYPTPDQIANWLAGGGVRLQATRMRATQITDGLSNTILLVEGAGRPQLWVMGKLADASPVVPGAGWADPGGQRPILGDPVNQCIINCSNDSGIYSFHPGGANFPFADGSVRFLVTATSPRTVVALLTAAAGDQPESDY
jgi:prepilin-type processing-associated H-X9-DG protein